MYSPELKKWILKMTTLLILQDEVKEISLKLPICILLYFAWLWKLACELDNIPATKVTSNVVGTTLKTMLLRIKLMPLVPLSITLFSAPVCLERWNLKSKLCRWTKTLVAASLMALCVICIKTQRLLITIKLIYCSEYGFSHLCILKFDTEIQRALKRQGLNKNVDRGKYSNL